MRSLKHFTLILFAFLISQEAFAQSRPLPAQTFGAVKSPKLIVTGPGSTGPIDDMSVTAAGTGAVARAISDKLRDLPVFPQDYWTGPPEQFCDGATNVQSAYQRAADIARDTGRPLHVGGKRECVLGSTVALSGRMAITGDGPAQSVLTGLFNGPIFTWTASGSEVGYSQITGFSLRGQFSSTADYSASRGFLVQGDATSFFQYNRFRGVVFESLYSAFEIAKQPITTSFGLESTAAWLTFDDITIRGGSRPAVYGWIWQSGSGTGTTFSNIKTSMSGPDGAVFYYPNNVVGDIVITGGHFGAGTPGGKLLKVGAGTNYRNNILMVGNQLDANMDVPFDLPSNSPIFERITFVGNNVGGGVHLKTPPVASSQIQDQLVDFRTAGKSFATNGIGTIALPVFSVTFDGITPFTGASCKVVASGLVGGVAGGVTRASFLLARNGGDPTVLADGAPVSTVSAPQFYTITAAPVTGTGQVNIVVTFTTSAANTNLNAQIQCTGGTYAVERL